MWRVEQRGRWRTTHQLRNDERCDESTGRGVDVDVHIPSGRLVLLLERIVQTFDILVLASVGCAQDGADEDRVLIIG